MTNSEESQQPAVSIIIVNWNGAAFLFRCLEALRKQTFRDFEILIVDNGSEDGSPEQVEREWPQVRLIRLERNYGFAVANNCGVQQARGRWVALLNNDAFPQESWLEELVKAAGQNAVFRFFGSCLYQPYERQLLDGTGDVYHVSGLAWRRAHNAPLDAAGQRPEEIFGPCAAAALYWREAFLAVDGFDEDFFSYHEDVDLSFRLRLAGERCLYIPTACVEHIGSATTGKKSDFSVYYGHRNLVWTYFKNMPGYLFWRYLPAHLMVNLVFLAYFSLRGQGGAIWEAKWHAMKRLPVFLDKRRKIQSQRQVSEAEIKAVLKHGWSDLWKNYRARLGR